MNQEFAKTSTPVENPYSSITALNREETCILLQISVWLTNLSPFDSKFFSWNNKKLLKNDKGTSTYHTLGIHTEKRNIKNSRVFTLSCLDQYQNISNERKNLWWFWLPRKSEKPWLLVNFPPNLKDKLKMWGADVNTHKLKVTEKREWLKVKRVKYVKPITTLSFPLFSSLSLSLLLLIKLAFYIPT